MWTGGAGLWYEGIVLDFELKSHVGRFGEVDLVEGRFWFMRNLTILELLEKWFKPVWRHHSAKGCQQWWGNMILFCTGCLNKRLDVAHVNSFLLQTVSHRL